VSWRTDPHAAITHAQQVSVRDQERGTASVPSCLTLIDSGKRISDHPGKG
jgi:hypothetical protein